MKILLFTIVFMTLYSCSKKINEYKDGDRHGKWVQIDTLNNIIYKSIGNYNDGNETKRWRYYENGMLVKKEFYCKNKCSVKVYNVKGKLQKKGITRTDINDEYLHWYYDGKWKFYDDNGKLKTIIYFDKGNPRDTIR